MKNPIVWALLGVSAVFALASFAQETKTPVAPRVYFKSPHNGATVSPEFTAEFGVQGMTVEPAGAVAPYQGHFHLLIDTDPVAAGKVIPKDAQHLHYGKGETSAKVKLSPGPHKLTLEFADGSHTAYGPIMSKTIQVTVSAK